MLLTLCPNCRLPVNESQSVCPQCTARLSAGTPARRMPVAAAVAFLATMALLRRRRAV